MVMLVSLLREKGRKVGMLLAVLFGRRPAHGLTYHGTVTGRWHGDLPNVLEIDRIAPYDACHTPIQLETVKAPDVHIQPPTMLGNLPAEDKVRIIKYRLLAGWTCGVNRCTGIRHIWRKNHE